MNNFGFKKKNSYEKYYFEYNETSKWVASEKKQSHQTLYKT